MTTDTLCLDRHDEQAGATLVDTKVLGMLRTIMPADEFDGLLRFGVLTYHEYLRRMNDPLASDQQIRADAHKLKGSAGSLGLRRLSALGQRLEEGAASDEVPALLREATWSLGATHQMLIQGGFIGDTLVDIPV